MIAHRNGISTRNADGEVVAGAFRIGLSREPRYAIALGGTTEIAFRLDAVDAEVGPAGGAAEWQFGADRRDARVAAGIERPAGIAFIVTAARILITFRAADGVDHIDAILIPFEGTAGFSANRTDFVDAVLIPISRHARIAAIGRGFVRTRRAPARCARISTNGGDLVDTARVPRIATVGGRALRRFVHTGRSPA